MATKKKPSSPKAETPPVTVEALDITVNAPPSKDQPHNFNNPEGTGKCTVCDGTEHLNIHGFND